MEALAWKIIQGIVVRLLSERLFSAGLVIGLRAISRRTSTDLDDALTREVATALGRADLLQD